APAEPIRTGGRSEHAAVVIAMADEAVDGLKKRFHGRIGQLRCAGYYALAWRAAAADPGRADQHVVLARIAGGQQTNDVRVERNDIRGVGGEPGISRRGSPGGYPHDAAWPRWFAGDRVRGLAVGRD